MCHKCVICPMSRAALLLRVTYLNIYTECKNEKCSVPTGYSVRTSDICCKQTDLAFWLF